MIKLLRVCSILLVLVGYSLFVSSLEKGETSNSESTRKTINARLFEDVVSVLASARDKYHASKQEATDPSTPVSWCYNIWNLIITSWVTQWYTFPPKEPQTDVVLIGDSNLDHWDNEDYCGDSCIQDLFPTAHWQNLGIGGTTCGGLYWFVPGLLARHANGTKAFVIHCGQNDMEFGGCDETAQELVGVTADAAFESFKSIVRTILTTHSGPEAPQILYPGGGLYPASPHRWAEFKRYDQLMREHAILLASRSPSRPPLVFIDADAVFSAMGNPSSLYNEDQVHFSPTGYSMWGLWIDTALNPSEADKDCVVWENNQCVVHGADVPQCPDHNSLVEYIGSTLGFVGLNCEKLRDMPPGNKCESFYVRTACPQTCDVTDRVAELQQIARNIGFPQIKTCQDALAYVSCEDGTYGTYFSSLCPCTCNYKYFP